MSAKNFMSYGDAETVLTGFANAIKNIKDGTELDSFGDVEVALLDKADTSDLGTAAAKDSTNSVTSGSTDLVESGAVKDAIDAAVASAYHHAGTKTVAQLTHDLLIAANEGNVYNITDSGTTTSDFIEGIGKQIDAGDNVGICKVGNVYMFDLLSGLEDTSIFVQKSQTSGLLKNDGTVNTTIEDTVAGHTAAIAGKQDKYETITYAQWQVMTPEQQAEKDYYISNYPSSQITAGNISYDNTESGMDATELQSAVDELKSGLTNLLKRGYFNIACQQGKNIFNTKTAQLVSGSFPDVASDCIFQIVNHGTSYSSPNVIEVDGSETIIITATVAQNIQVMWIQFSNIPLTN